MARDPALWLAIGRNVVSALARDLLVDRMFALEDAGFPIVFTVHDGIVCEHPQITQEGSNRLCRYGRVGPKSLACRSSPILN